MAAVQLTTKGRGQCPMAAELLLSAVMSTLQGMCALRAAVKNPRETANQTFDVYGGIGGFLVPPGTIHIKHYIRSRTLRCFWQHVRDIAPPAHALYGDANGSVK